MHIIFNILFWIILLISLYRYITNVESDFKVVKIIFMIIALRLIYANIKYLLGIPPAFPDASFYKDSINSIVNSGMNFSIFNDRLDVKIYVYFYSIIQFISGNIYVTIININSILGSMAIYNAGRISKEIKNQQAQCITMFLLLIYPSFILYTNDNLREGIVLYFITLSIYHIIRYIKYRDLNEFIIYMGLLIPVFLTRSVNMPIMTLIGVIAFTIVNKEKIKLKYLIVIIILILMAMIFFIYKYTSIRINLNYINQVLNRDRLDSSAYLVGVRYDSWIELIIYIPIRMFYFMFHPFPWVVSSYKHLSTTISSIYEFLIFLSIIAIALKYFKKLKNDKLLCYFIVFILVGITIYAIVKTEAAARHRLQFIWGMMTILGVLITNFNEYENNYIHSKISNMLNITKIRK